MLFGFWDVDEHACDKLKWVDRLGVVDIVASFGLINKEPRFGMITKSRQIHWRALQVASEAMESFGVAGINRGVIVKVLAPFTVGDIYASPCRKGTYVHFDTHLRSRALIGLQFIAP